MEIKLKLPKKENVYQTEEGDPVLLHYKLSTGWMYKKRLKNTLSFFPKKKNKRILDVGYGSGILFPSLLELSEVCYGLDIHKKRKEVYEMLKKEGVNKKRVILKEGDIKNIPFKNNFFDGVVCVSTLEHIDPKRELAKSISEIKRVTKKEGFVILSFPVRNVITDLFYKIKGFDPRKIHPASHKDIIKEAKRFFIIKKMKVFPNLKNIDFSLYCTLLCLKK